MKKLIKMLTASLFISAQPLWAEETGASAICDLSSNGGFVTVQFVSLTRNLTEEEQLNWGTPLQESVAESISFTAMFGVHGVGELFGEATFAASISGNGNSEIFTRQFPYKRVGNRIEVAFHIYRTIRTNIDEDEFSQIFGSAPEVTCRIY